MSDVSEALESLKAYYIHRRDNLKRSVSDTEENIELVDGLIKLQDRNNELEEENALLRARNDQLAAELRDAQDDQSRSDRSEL